MHARLAICAALMFGAMAVAAIATFYVNRELYYTVDELADRGWLAATPSSGLPSGVSPERATSVRASRALSGDGTVAADRRWQVRGTVDRESIVRTTGQWSLRFTLRGTRASMPVNYEGVIPDTFAQAVTVTVGGRMLSDGVFAADHLSAQCPSKYQPAPTRADSGTANAKGGRVK